jgi:uncharacterized protein (DUF58 family)
MSRDLELLEPAFLARLERLVRIARRAPPPRPQRKRRFLSRGKGVEVASYRDYTPGDDLRLLDWAAYARLERFYVRLVEEVVEPRLDILIDTSGSMGEGDPEPLRRATRVAAAVSAVALARGSRVACWALADGIVARTQPLRGPGRLVSLLRFLGGLEARGPTALAKGARSIAHAARLRGGALLVSDLLHPEDAAAALERLRRSGFDVLAVEVTPRSELSELAALAASRAGSALLVDAETGEQRRVPFASESLDAAARERSARSHDAARRLAPLGASRARLAWDRPVEEIALALLEGDGARAAAARLAREHEPVLR